MDEFFSSDPTYSSSNCHSFEVPTSLPTDTLEKYAITGAELYALIRYPLPRCHPETRISLIHEITQWMEGKSGEECNLMWVYGPAGAGKTAVAQTIGEAADGGRTLPLGAAFFFLRPRNLDNPGYLCDSIYHQLLRRYEILLRPTKNRPRGSSVTAFGADIRTQLKKLIKPILVKLDRLLRSQVIIIDGLDECNGEEEQCQIIESICDIIPGARGVRWLIFSRPEPHLKRAFEKAQSQGLCLTIEVPTDDPETRGDIERYLNDGFNKIRNSRYFGRQVADQDWPKPDDMNKIFRAASGIFVYADTILKFVDDPTVRDPVSQLQIVIDFIDGLPLPPGTSNPLAFIDRLYVEIIGRTLQLWFVATLRILGTCAICPPLPALYLAHLLVLDVWYFLDSLRYVHSIVAVPSEERIAEEPLRFFHASFPDFLMNPTRSGSMAQDANDCRIRLAKTLFDVLKTSKVSYADIVSQRYPFTECKMPSSLSVSDSIVTYAATHVWEISAQVSAPSAEFICDTIGTFDFRRLESLSESIPPRSFIKFLLWLRKLVRQFLQILNDSVTRSYFRHLHFLSSMALFAVVPALTWIKNSFSSVNRLLNHSYV